MMMMDAYFLAGAEDFSCTRGRATQSICPGLCQSSDGFSHARGNDCAGALWSCRQRHFPSGQVRPTGQANSVVTYPCRRPLAPQLLERVGIGVEVAGQMLVTAGDNPNRMKSEAAFAMLCGVASLPACLRHDTTTPAQPRRRPASQPGAAPGHHHPTHPTPPNNSSLTNRRASGAVDTPVGSWPDSPTDTT